MVLGTHLDAEGRLFLVEEEVPDVQGPVRLGGEEHSRLQGAPARVQQVGSVVPSSRATLSHTGTALPRSPAHPSTQTPLPPTLSTLYRPGEDFWPSKQL